MESVEKCQWSGECALNYAELENNVYRSHVKHILFFFSRSRIVTGPVVDFEFSLKMAQRKALKELKLKEKVDLLNFLENSSQRKTAEIFGVSKTTVSNILKRKEEYLERYSFENGGLQRKRRKTCLDAVNEATFRWFKEMRSINARISGPMLQEVAKKFAKEFEIEDFQASAGWLEKFKLRCEISQKVLCGESNEVSAEVVEKFIEKFPEFAKGFKDEDIFNADECGLFFKAMPDRSLVMKGDTCKRGKLSKQRFTVLLCASMTGEKLKPMVIGKSAKPRAFKNVKPEDLPVFWRANKSAWMTSALFEEWVRGIDAEMRKKKRSILLTLDNCPSHFEVTNLTNVKLKFLPPNTTSKTQPLDQGIIQSFKVHYRAQLLEWVIMKAQTCGPSALASSTAASVNALNAVHWINSAWNKVTQATIKNCFKKAGFVTATTSVQKDELPVSPLPVFDGVDFEDYVTMDNELVTCVEPDPEAIFNEILSTTKHSEDSKVEEMDGEEDDDPSDDEAEKYPTLKEDDVKCMMEQLKDFAAEKCPSMLNGLINCESAFCSYLMNKKRTQTKIESFFQKL